MRFLISLLILLCVSCAKDYNKDPLPDILNSKNPKIKNVMDSLDKYEIQIKVSELTPLTDSGKGGLFSMDYDFQINDSNYFYPASSVKFPIAVLALEKVNTLDGINSETQFYIEGDTIETTIRKDINAIFAISDNDAYNRLYEFLGTNHINQTLKNKGFEALQIAHRLSTLDARNPTTKPIVFKLNDTTTTQQEAIINSSITPLKLSRLAKGKGYYANSKLVQEPMDFSEKNYISISTLHEMMKRVRFPDAFQLEERFILNKEDYKFLLKSMQNRPRDIGYDESEYYDGYVKFFGYGDTKERIPDYLKISNKVGYAYGYLTDCALFEDKKHGISFLITATIHVNHNQIFNDDNYQYEAIGIPFLGELGRQLHSYYIEKELYLDEHGD